MVLVSYSGFANTVTIQKPSGVLFNHVTPEGTPYDPFLRSAFGKNYFIFDIGDNGFTGPSPIAGSMPREAFDANGKPIYGYLVIGYVVTAKGSAVDPVVIKSTDKRINVTAFYAMKGWRFTPAVYANSNVASLAVQEFYFRAPNGI